MRQRFLQLKDIYQTSKMDAKIYQIEPLNLFVLKNGMVKRLMKTGSEPEAEKCLSK